MKLSSPVVPCTVHVLWFVHVKLMTKIIPAGKAAEITHLYKVVSDQITSTFSVQTFDPKRKRKIHYFSFNCFEPTFTLLVNTKTSRVLLLVKENTKACVPALRFSASERNFSRF